MQRDVFHRDAIFTYKEGKCSPSLVRSIAVRRAKIRRSQRSAIVNERRSEAIKSRHQFLLNSPSTTPNLAQSDLHGVIGVPLFSALRRLHISCRGHRTILLSVNYRTASVRRRCLQNFRPHNASLLSGRLRDESRRRISEPGQKPPRFYVSDR